MVFHRLGIVPYGPSNSAKFLRRELGIRRFNSRDSYGVLVNWGCASYDKTGRAFRTLLNKPENVRKCTDKTLTYDRLNHGGVESIWWTLDKEVALQFGFPLLLRTNFLSQGRGITIINNEAELNNVRPRQGQYFAKFYKSSSEFRVHIFRDKLLGWQRKLLNNEEGEEQVIRNHGNGYRFSLRDNGEINRSLLTKCINAIKVLNLDFGAIDVLLDNNRHYRILEVNSAPGLDEGSTILNKYVEEFRNVQI